MSVLATLRARISLRLVNPPRNLIRRKEIGVTLAEDENVSKRENVMSVGDIAFLVLVTGSLTLFALTLGFYSWFASEPNKRISSERE